MPSPNQGEQSAPADVNSTLHEYRQRLQTVIENAPVILWSIDPQGIITLSEGAGLKALGLEGGEDVGRSVYEQYGQEPGLLNLIERSLAGEEFTSTVGIRGTMLEVSSRPMYDAEGRFIGAIGVTTDVTQRVRAEQALAQAMEELEDRVRERTAQLSQANAVLQREVAQRQRVEEALLTEQRSLLYLLGAHERDRQLTAYELHDGLVQQIAAARMSLEALANSCDTPQRERFAAVQQILRDAVAESRRVVGGLRPPIIDELGVVPAVEYLVDQRRAEGLDVQWEQQVQFDRLAPLLEATIFRIVQESLHNAARHSSSPKVRVALKQHGQQVRIEVDDWGRGFETQNIPEGRYGLRGIRERARLLGGNADIHSAPGQGTQVRVTLPLAHAPTNAEGIARA